MAGVKAAAAKVQKHIDGMTKMAKEHATKSETHAVSAMDRMKNYEANKGKIHGSYERKKIKPGVVMDTPKEPYPYGHVSKDDPGYR